MLSLTMISWYWRRRLDGAQMELLRRIYYSATAVGGGVRGALGAETYVAVFDTASATAQGSLLCRRL
jgi:hypothetical protein